MANGGDPRPSQNPAAVPRLELPNANPPRLFLAPRPRVNLTQESRSLINSFRSAALTPQQMETCWQSLFNLMTSREVEDEVRFREVTSRLYGNDLPNMASLLTSNSDRFLEIARNKNGSFRLKKLIGRSDAADTFFVTAILDRFFDVMTNRLTSNVAIKGLRVFSEEKKVAMYDLILHHALNLARDRRGCITLNEIITDLDHPYYRCMLLNIVTFNAFMLSCDAYGSFVVQHLLKMQDGHCTNNIAARLNGRCVYLSLNRYGSYIVQKLLETEWRYMVVTELLSCEGDRLMRVARSVYGNFVVVMALRVTQVESNIFPELFWGLVDKLKPFLPLMRVSLGSNVAAFLDSIG